MKFFPLFLAAAACLLAGCDDDENPLQRELNENRAKWEAADINSYVFESSQAYFIVEEPIVVTVTNDVVTSAFFTPSGVMVSAERLASMRTIDGHFDIVQNAIDEDAVFLNVSYDDTFGFPADIAVDYREEVADDEISYFIRNFQ